MSCENFLSSCRNHSLPSLLITLCAKNKTSQWEQVPTTNQVNDAAGPPVNLWTHAGSTCVCLSITRMEFYGPLVSGPGRSKNYSSFRWHRPADHSLCLISFHTCTENTSEINGNAEDLLNTGLTALRVSRGQLIDTQKNPSASCGCC